MNQIIIGKTGVALNAKIGGGTISGINEINQLAAGAVAVFTDDNVMLTTVNVVTAMADKKGVYFAVGSGDATKGADISIITERLKVNYIKKAYVAPVKLVKFIGNDGTIGSMNFPSPLVAGTEAFVRITDTTPGTITTGQNTRRYSYVVKVGDVNADIVNALIASINADTDRFCDALAVGASVGIQLTGRNFGQTFAISLDGIIVSADKEEPEGVTPGASVAVNYGSGTEAQIIALEDAFSAEKGNTNKIYQPALWYSRASKVTSGATYDMYTITWNGKKVRTVDGGLPTVVHQILVALPAAATQQAAFETLMAEVFGNAETEETGS